MNTKHKSGTMANCRGEKGFTLVELMMAMFVGLIVAAMLFVTLERQSRTFTAESQKTEAQMKIVSVADLMARDIRQGGYLEPEDRIREAAQTVFSFRGDVDHSATDDDITENLDIGMQIEEVRYRFQPPDIAMSNTSIPDGDYRKHNGKLYRSVDGIERLFVDSLDEVKFEYMDAAGSVVRYSDLALAESKRFRDRIARIQITIKDSATSPAVSANMGKTMNPYELRIAPRAIIFDVAPPNLSFPPLVECGALVTQIGPSPLNACDPPGSIAAYTVKTYELDANGENVLSTKNQILLTVSPASSVYTDGDMNNFLTHNATITIPKPRTASSYTYYIQSATKDVGVGNALAITAAWKPPEEGCAMKYYTAATPIGAGLPCDLEISPKTVNVQGCSDPGSGCSQFRDVEFTVTDKCGNPVNEVDVDFQIIPAAGDNNTSGKYGKISTPGVDNYDSADLTDTEPLTLKSDPNGDIRIRFWATDQELPYIGFRAVTVKATISNLSTECGGGGTSDLYAKMTACIPTNAAIYHQPFIGCTNTHYPVIVKLLDKCGHYVSDLQGMTVKIKSERDSNETLSSFSDGLNPSPPASTAILYPIWTEPVNYLFYYNTRTDTAQRYERANLELEFTAPLGGTDYLTFSISEPVNSCSCSIANEKNPEYFCDPAGGLSYACAENAVYVAHGGARAEDNYGVVTATTSSGETQMFYGNISSPTGPTFPTIPVSGYSLFNLANEYQWPFWMRNDASVSGDVPNRVPIGGGINLHLSEYGSDNTVRCEFDYQTKVLCSQSTLEFVSKDTVDGVDTYYPTISYDPYYDAERVYVELNDCNRPDEAAISVTIYANEGDQETLSLTTGYTDKSDTYYRNVDGLPITAMYLPVPNDGTLQVGADNTIWAEYTDPTAGCNCSDESFAEVNMYGYCVSAALYSGSDAEFGGTAFRVHWGDVVVYDDVSFSSGMVPSKNRTMAVADTASPYSSSWSDPWMDVYVGGRMGSGSTSLKQPFYLSDGYANIYHEISSDSLDCIMAKLDYDDVKTFALSNDVYYYAVDNTQIVQHHSDGTEEAPVNFADVLANDHRRFIFIDLIDAPSLNPQPTSATIDAKQFDSAFPTFTLTGNVYYKGFLYIAGNLNVSALGSGSTITAQTPPLSDKEQALFPPNGEGAEGDLPINYDQGSAAGVEVALKVHINGSVYLEGTLNSAASLNIFGAIASERGYTGSSNPEIWYNYANSRGCAQRSCCVLSISPNDVQVEVGTTQQLVALGGSGGQTIWSFVTNNSGGTLSSTGLYTPGDVIGAVDTVQAEDVGGCRPNTTTLTVVCKAIAITGDTRVIVGFGDKTYTASGGNPPYTWTVDNTSYATIGSSTGILHPILGTYNVAVTATDSTGCTATLTVAVVLDPGCVTLFEDNFESGLGKWTSYGSTQNDWQSGTVYGECTDPAAPPTGGGSYILGTDLGYGSGWNGCYPSNNTEYITTNVFSGVVGGVGYKSLEISFKKYNKIGGTGTGKSTLTFLYKCGAGAWTTATTFSADTSWADFNMAAASNICRNEPSIQLRFQLVSKTTVTGGFNIDNFKVCGHVIY